MKNEIKDVCEESPLCPSQYDPLHSERLPISRVALENDRLGSFPVTVRNEKLLHTGGVILLLTLSVSHELLKDFTLGTDLFLSLAPVSLLLNDQQVSISIL